MTSLNTNSNIDLLLNITIVLPRLNSNVFKLEKIRNYKDIYKYKYTY